MINKINPNSYYKDFTYYNKFTKMEYDVIYTDNAKYYLIGCKYANKTFIKLNKRHCIGTIKSWNKLIKENSYYTKIMELTKEEVFLEML